MQKIPVVAIVGPTASGKTGLSIEIAKKLNGEIICADSMQIYKDMDIATASPTKEEKGKIEHHLFNFVEPSENFSVANYVKYAHQKIKEVYDKGKLPILVGGTGLYIDSLLKNIEFIEIETNQELRDSLYQEYLDNGVDYLLDKVKDIDIDSYERLKEQKNVKRIIRCIEVFILTGKTQTEININSKLTPSLYNFVKIGLKAQDREYLYDRINKRVDIMLDNGLLDEAKSFIKRDNSNTSSMAIGYKELLPYLENIDTLDNCVESLKMATRRYAKRQLTWFTKDQNVHWFDIDVNSFEEILNQALKIIEDDLNVK